MFEIFKQRIIDWCLSKETITVQELHERYNRNPVRIYDESTNELKFIEQTGPDNVFIKTPTGYSPIAHTHKTVVYDVWVVTTHSHKLYCADTHILIDCRNQERFVRDLQSGDMIKTETGHELIESIEPLSKSDNMYDIELDDDNHVYYTNGLLSHNSITSASYLLWYAMFNFDQTILIASNKNSGAMEMVYRIRFAYESLPFWLKPGVTDDGYNKHAIGFDNGSRIVSAATSEDTGRGMSISLLFLDEFAFVPTAVAEDFWVSIKPTLATGGSCIIASTPNGDMNIFAQLWRAALVEANSFVATWVKWDQPPGRDKKFKKTEIADIGERKWLQEYECCGGNANVTVEYPGGLVETITMEELYASL